jgi:hypothetical protein
MRSALLEIGSIPDSATHLLATTLGIASAVCLSAAPAELIELEVELPGCVVGAFTLTKNG